MPTLLADVDPGMGRWRKADLTDASTGTFAGLSRSGTARMLPSLRRAAS
jgi:hypothetical protein